MIVLRILEALGIGILAVAGAVLLWGAVILVASICGGLIDFAIRWFSSKREGKMDKEDDDNCLDFCGICNKPMMAQDEKARINGEYETLAHKTCIDALAKQPNVR